MIPTPPAPKVGIIGGGPGGLMSAYLLNKKLDGICRITMFEAGERLGGKLFTARFGEDGDLYEAGAAELYDYSHLGPDPLRELVAEVGLTTSPMAGGSAIIGEQVVHQAGDLRAVWGEATASSYARFAVLARTHISPANYYESDWRQDNHDPLARQKFHELLDRVADERARDYIRLMTHSDLACEPHQTNAVYGLQNFLMDETDYMRLYSIDGGNERLTQELARRITAEVRLQQPVVRVEESRRRTYLVTSRHRGNLQVEEFDFVIVALPNNWIPAIAWGGDALAGAMARHHRFYDHPAHYLRVTARFAQPFWRTMISGSFFMSDAFGGCCLYDEGTRFASADDGAVLSWLIAGEPALTLANLDDAAVIDQVLASLPASLQVGRTLLREARVHRWLNTVNALPGGFPAAEPDARHQPDPLAHPGVLVVGDYLFDSTLNGVLDSADTAVELLVKQCTPPGAPDNLAAAAAPARSL